MPVFVDENTLKRFYGDREFLSILRHEFARDIAPEYLFRLKEALNKKDAPRVAEVAHAFKNACGTVGAVRVQNVVSKIEQAIRMNYQDMVINILPDLEKELNLVTKILSKGRERI